MLADYRIAACLLAVVAGSPSWAIDSKDGALAARTLDLNLAIE